MVQSATFDQGKKVYVTQGKEVLSSGPREPMPECDHEEADIRVCLRLKDGLEKGARTVILRTVDTDVIVILVGQFRQLTKDYPHTSIRLAFGMGKILMNICINTIFEKLGRKISFSSRIPLSYW